MTSPTQKTLAKLRKEGYLCAVVEKFNPFVKVRQDLFSFIDILALKPGQKTLAVQTTTDNHVAERVAKIKVSKNYAMVKLSGWKVQVHGWKKKGNRWELRIVDL